MRLVTPTIACHCVKNERGTSLFDIIFSILILAFGAAAIFSLITASASANRRAADELIAANIARQEIELLRSTDTTLLTNRTSSSFVGSFPQLNQLAAGQAFLTIADYPYLTGAKQVTVRINWISRNCSASRSLTMSTLFVHGGVGI